MIKRIKMYNLRKVIEEQLKTTFENELLEARVKIMENKLGISRQNLINEEKVSDPRNTFVLLMFVKPGRTHLFIRAPQTRDA